jgi:hypothetical protein
MPALTLPCRTTTRLFDRTHSRLRHTSLRTTSFFDIPFHLLYCFFFVAVCISLCRLFCVLRHRVFLYHSRGLAYIWALSYWVTFSTCIGAPEYKWALGTLVAYTFLGMLYEKRIELCLHCEAAFARQPSFQHLCDLPMLESVMMELPC